LQDRCQARRTGAGGNGRDIDEDSLPDALRLRREEGAPDGRAVGGQPAADAGRNLAPSGAHLVDVDDLVAVQDAQMHGLRTLLLCLEEPGSGLGAQSGGIGGLTADLEEAQSDSVSGGYSLDPSDLAQLLGE